MDLSQTVTGRLHFFDACFEGYPFATFQVCEISSFLLIILYFYDILRTNQIVPHGKMHRESSSGILPGLNVQLGQHFFPIFHVVFLHKGRFEDG